ncbi:pentapeptide repeat-containing protein [Cyanobium sp. BSA11S]|uniref:pentapeptide repeat-containing protein n=1 Tax=Synechococcales TaxID=1890424 RepID=UPI0021072439|nr:pentapeptide repeat-containing protein [Synechococcus sp. BSF8S]
MHGARVEDRCFQQALLWGADLSELKAARSFWHSADLSAARLHGEDFSGASLHRWCVRGVLAADNVWWDARVVEVDFRSSLNQLTDLGQVDVAGADLSFALLQGPHLRGA